MAALGRSGEEALPRVDAILADVRVLPFDATQAQAARDAFLKYGKGRHPGARLNFGDCIAYALAKTTKRPLLFMGEDFSHTDLESATTSESTGERLMGAGTGDEA